MKPPLHFLDNRDGGVAIMAGIVIMAIATAAGGAIDYSNAMKQRGSLQALADASAISAARLGKGLSLAEYEKAATDFFMGSSACQSMTCRPPAVTLADNGAVRVDADVDVPTYLLGILGVDTVPVSVVSQAIPPDQFGVDVMMVLDYSGSMSWNDKYKQMAEAAKDFIDRSGEREGDSMRVGVVPFARYVLTPLDGQYAYDIAGGAVLTGLDIVGCTLNRQYPHSVSSDTPVGGIIGSLWPVDSYTTGSAAGASSYSQTFEIGVKSGTTLWNSDGLTGQSYTYEYYDLYPQQSSITQPTVTDRGTGGLEIDGHQRFAVRWVNPPSAYRLTNIHAWSNVPTDFFNGYGDASGWDTPADGSLPSDFNAHQLAEALTGNCSKYAEKSLWARPLSSEFEKMKDAIDKMEPLGATNIALALDFGWHYLTGNAPFTESTTASEVDTRQSILLLSDGTQTVPAHGASGFYNIDSANANILETCTAAKAAGVDIYTIAFEISDATTRDLMKNCSSGNNFYYEANGGNELNDAFDDIFDSISPTKTRITM